MEGERAEREKGLKERKEYKQKEKGRMRRREKH